MNGRNTLSNDIKTNTNITDLLDSYNGFKCVAGGTKIPDEWSLAFTCILINSLNPIDKVIPYLFADYNIYCRAETESKSEALAYTIISELNRNSTTDTNGKKGRYYFTVQTTLQPLDKNDNYNTILNVNVKGSQNLK